MFGFINKGIQQMMIARPEAAHRLIIYKWPDRTIPMYSRLTVKSDEGAVFYKNGVCMGVLGPGVHSLDGANIPFLKNLIDGATGGNTLLGEVFFVRSQPNRNDPIKFGKQLSMIDPGTGVPCNPGVHGELVVRVVDPVAFILGIAGQSLQPEDNTAILGWLSKRMADYAEPILANFLKGTGESLLNMSALRGELEKALMAAPPAALSEVGLQLVELTTLNVVLNAEQRREVGEVWKQTQVGGVEDKLNAAELRRQMQRRQMEIGVNVAERAAYVDLAQNPGYMQYAQAEAIIGAGQGMANGGGNAGIAGLGAQMAIGAGMAGMFQPAMQYQRVAAPAGGAVCGGCSFNNVGGGKFCANCGQPLAPPRPAGSFCTGCGTQNAAGAKFCASCGASQAAAAPPAGG